MAGPLVSAAPYCILAVKVIPNARRNELAGRLGDAVKIKIHAPPVEGRANDALCDFLAERLGIPRRSISMISGTTSRQKRVRIENLSLDEVHSRLRL